MIEPGADQDLPMDGRREAFSPERWHQIETLLGEALDLPCEERGAMLERACAQDRALREALERLLRAHDQAGSFLEEPVERFVAPILALHAPLMAAVPKGARVGPYRVVRQVGHGGMGAVYLAERDDGQFHKRVALKLLAAGWSLDDDLLRRFREERQILASLEHPGIARLIDGGVTEDGLPYFVMEYVEGVPIDHHCDDHALTIEARLALFCAVCDAVQYAHRNRIVHRDLKPSNILVTPQVEQTPAQPRGQVKLLDFGIAKMVQPAESGERAERTRPALRLMTPEYASPEQLRGEAVSPASDVYSLGVLLYRLLTGRHPGALFDRRSGEIERVVLEARPQPPSTVVCRREGLAGGARSRHAPPPEQVSRARGTTPKRLRRRLRGDLDAITLKALASETTHRYATAGELGADLSRHLDGRPVVAQQRGRLARARALAHRHPVRLTVGVALLALTGAAAWASRPATSPTLASGSVIAVLPFTPSVPDTALVRLGHDLAVTLAANLDGVGELHTVDVRPLFHANNWTGERAAEAARRLGAGAVVRGTLVSVGDLVRADAALFIGSSARAAARASVTAAPDALAALTDSLTWTMLRQVWRTGTPPAPSLEAITTRSLPALRAFLDGERLLIRGDYRDALQAFARAIESDSTFWYAYWRYARASGQIERPVETRIVEAYIAHRFEFPERDRLLIEAGMTDSLSVYLTRMRALTDRFRDYWPAWWDYANRLVHDGSLFGYTHAEARAALEQTLALNPRLVPAWDHLFWLAAADGDTLVAARSLTELARLLSDSGTDLITLHHFRNVQRLMRTGSRKSTPTDSMPRNLIAAARSDARPEWFDQGLLLYGFPQATIDGFGRVLQLAPPDPVVAVARRGIAGAWAARGAWDSALVAVGRYANSTADPAATLYAYRVAAVGLWAGGVDVDDARRWRTALAPTAGRLAPDHRAELAWLDGVVAAVRQDRPALAAARLVLRQTDARSVAVLDGSLAAFEFELDGERERAARTLTGLERARAEHASAYRRLADWHPYLTAVNRLTASRWLLALGDTATAAAFLVFHEGVPFPLPLTGHANYVLAGPAYLERARLEEAAGRTDIARTYYWQFLRRYDMPVPSHVPLVEEARAALDRVSRRDR